MRSTIISIGTLIILFTSCGVRYEVFTSYQIDPWDKADEKFFDFNVSTGSYSADLVINHDINYRFENLYLVIETQSEVGLSVDTISVQLANKDGLWVGDCNSLSCSYTMRWADGLTPDSDGINLQIKQFSREEVLTGIRSIGVGLIRD